MKNTKNENDLVFISHEEQLEHIASICALELFEEEINSELAELTNDDWAIINSIDMHSSLESILQDHKKLLRINVSSTKLRKKIKTIDIKRRFIWQRKINNKINEEVNLVATTRTLNLTDVLEEIID